jgi:hypothetical protein
VSASSLDFLRCSHAGQRILRIPFTGSVKLRSILLKTGPADQTPTKVALVRPLGVTLFTLHMFDAASSQTRTRSTFQT